MIYFKKSDPWIFLSIAYAAGGQLASLDQIIGTADGINHAIPNDDEIEEGFTHLLQSNLIRLRGRKLGLTSSGIKLAKRCTRKSKYLLKQWTFLDELFKTEAYPQITQAIYKLESGEAHKAYEKYHKRFWKTYREIIKKENVE